LTLLLFGGGASLMFVSDLGMLAWIPLGGLSAWIVLTGQLTPAATQPDQGAMKNVAQAGA
jgi:hypothetical protein